LIFPLVSAVSISSELPMFSFLACAGGPDEDADLAGGDRQRQVLDRGLVPAGVALRHVVEDDLGGCPGLHPRKRKLSPHGWGGRSRGRVYR
jgi:hypothetical protein